MPTEAHSLCMKFSNKMWQLAAHTEVSLLQPKLCSEARLLALRKLPTFIRGVSALTLKPPSSSPLGRDLTLNRDLLISLVAAWVSATLSSRLAASPPPASSLSTLSFMVSMVASSVAGSSMKSLWPLQQLMQHESAQKYFLKRKMTRVRHMATTNIIGPWKKEIFSDSAARNRSNSTSLHWS